MHNPIIIIDIERDSIDNSPLCIEFNIKNKCFFIHQNINKSLFTKEFIYNTHINDIWNYLQYFIIKLLDENKVIYIHNNLFKKNQEFNRKMIDDIKIYIMGILEFMIITKFLYY